MIRNTQLADGTRAPVEDVYPVTPLQAGMLVHARREPESAAYVDQYTFSLRGRLDVVALRRAWERVLDQHAVLRTGFAAEGMDGPRQVVHRRASLPWVVLDWRCLTESTQREQLELYLESQRKRGFDPGQPPLMRLTVVRLADDRSELVWTHHRLLLDGWSLALVLRDAFAVYEALLLRREPVLPRARPFREYVAWLQRQDLSWAEAFWREALEGVTAPTPLGIDRAAAGVRAGGGTRSVRHRLSPGATSDLRRLARRHRVTLNTVMHGAWGLLLSRYSGEDEVVFGATVSGRPPELPGIDEMVGLFVNTLPVRVRVDGGVRVGDWLVRLHFQQAAARRHEHCPLTELQRWSEVPAGVPLFESVVVFESAPLWTGVGGGEHGFSVEDWKVAGHGRYPLALTVLPGEQVELQLEYDPCRVDAGSAGRMMRHLEVVLEEMAADPDRPVSDVPVLTGAEQAELLRGRRGTVAVYPRLCVHEILAQRVARAPLAVAVIHGREELTFAELGKRAEQLARRLHSLGVGPEVRVALHLERSVELAVAILGVLRAGGAFVPLDPGFPRERLRFLLADSGARVVVTRTALAGALPGEGISVLCLDGEPGADSASGAGRPREAGPESLAYVLYPEGSAGAPGGVMVSHRSLVCHAEAMRERLGLRSDDRLLRLARPGSGVTVEEIFPAWLSGSAVVFPEGELPGSPEQVTEVVARQGVTGLQLPTASWHTWVRDLSRSRRYLPACVRFVVVGGERVLADGLAGWARLRVPLVHVFGPTETAVASTALRVEAGDDGSRWGSLPVGSALPNVEPYVLGAGMQPVPVGAAGELYLGGDGVARGYLGRAAATAERFVPHPFPREPGARLYRTGDRVRWLEDGNLEILGRTGRQVEVRAFQIEPAGIEAPRMEHPRVRGVDASVREEVPGDGRPVVCLVAGDGGGAARDPGGGAGSRAGGGGSRIGVVPDKAAVP